MRSRKLRELLELIEKGPDVSALSFESAARLVMDLDDLLDNLTKGICLPEDVIEGRVALMVAGAKLHSGSSAYTLVTPRLRGLYHYDIVSGAEL